MYLHRITFRCRGAVDTDPRLVTLIPVTTGPGGVNPWAVPISCPRSEFSGDARQ